MHTLLTSAAPAVQGRHTLKSKADACLCALGLCPGGCCTCTNCHTSRHVPHYNTTLILVAGVVGEAAVARGPLQHAQALGSAAALHVLPEPSHHLISCVVATAQLLPSAHIHIVVAYDHLGQLVRLQVAACGLGHMRSVSGSHDAVLCDGECVCAIFSRYECARAAVND